MNKISMFLWIILGISVIGALYVITSLILKKNKYKKGKIKKIANNKYIICITAIIILFVIYGLMRNFK